MSFNKIQAIKDARAFHELARDGWSKEFFEAGLRLMELGVASDKLRQFCVNTTGSLKEAKDFIEQEVGGFIIQGREMYGDFVHLGSRETFGEAMAVLESPSRQYGWNYYQYLVKERATGNTWYVSPNINSDF